MNIKGFFLLGVSATPGYREYDTAFNMMHKIIAFIGKIDSLVTLSGMIEYDDCYFGLTSKIAGEKGTKRGKGTN